MPGRETAGTQQVGALKRIAKATEANAETTEANSKKLDEILALLKQEDEQDDEDEQ